jgi:hypothetical protein
VQTNETTTHSESASDSECFSKKAPEAAPTNMLPTAPMRLCHRGLLPDTREESAANPVIVNVNTVVVRSCTASLRKRYAPTFDWLLLPRRAPESFL